MGSIRIYKGMPPLTEEQVKRLDALKDREIDLSDIPEITEEEFKKFKPSRLRKKKFENRKLKKFSSIKSRGFFC